MYNQILFWTDYKLIPHSFQLYATKDVKNIVIKPLNEPNLMYQVHQYVQEFRVKQLIRKASSIQRDIESITSILPQNVSRYCNQCRLWYEKHSIPKSRREVIVWEYFTSTKLYLMYEHMPVVGLPRSHISGIESSLEVLQDLMHTNFSPRDEVVDGFTVTDQSAGIYYTLHVSMHREDVKEPVEYIAYMFLPFQGPGMGTYKRFDVLLRTTVNIIVGTTQNKDISDFLDMYEKVCLKPGLNTHLHVVLFGECKNSKAKVTKLQRMYTRKSVSAHELPKKRFSYASTYNHVATKLSDKELMVLMDPDFVFEADFLNHCRMNADRGKQVYFPMFFSFYKPELVHKYIQQSAQMLISPDTGFFLHYNYQVVVIYKSDYEQVGNLRMNQGDDMQLLNKVLSSSLCVMRALEPSLRRLYKPRTCNEFTGDTRMDCMNSHAEAIGSKKLLGSFIIDHGLLDKISETL